MLFNIQSKYLDNENSNDNSCIINSKIISDVTKSKQDNKQFFRFSRAAAKALLNSKEPYKNKFALNIISISNDFFKKLPFYQRLQYHFN